MAEENVKKRFYRGKLPKLVWDKERDRKLCDFAEGHLTTDDPRVIKVLERIGYIEIPLDATVPPELYEPIQPDKTPDIKILPPGVTEVNAPAGKGLAEDHDGPAVDVPKPTAIKTKNTPSKNPKKSPKKTAAKSRKIKRREKK